MEAAPSGEDGAAAGGMQQNSSSKQQYKCAKVKSPEYVKKRELKQKTKIIAS